MGIVPLVGALSRWMSDDLLGCGTFPVAGWVNFPCLVKVLSQVGGGVGWWLLAPSRCQSFLLLTPEAPFARTCILYGSLLLFDQAVAVCLSVNTAVPDLFGTRDGFRGRQFFHGRGVAGGWFRR